MRESEGETRGVCISVSWKVPFSWNYLLYPCMTSRSHSSDKVILWFKTFLRDFPGSPVVKAPRFQCRGSNPGQETKIPHATGHGQQQQLSPGRKLSNTCSTGEWSHGQGGIEGRIGEGRRSWKDLRLNQKRENKKLQLIQSYLCLLLGHLKQEKTNKQTNKQCHRKTRIR